MFTVLQTSKPAASDKWRKRLLLARYGLTSVSELEIQTQRYCSVGELCSNLQFDGCTYIVKLVPIKYKPRLTNYILRSEQDLASMLDRIPKAGIWSEIWCCKNESATHLPVYGRFAICDTSQDLEMVRGVSARSLETIPAPQEYVTATRWTWGQPYVTEIKGSLPFRDVAIAIEARRSQIDLFAGDVSRIGINSLCLEFRVYGSRVVFIDWDSSDDRLVLDEMWE